MHRAPHQTDGRTTLARITPKGRRLVRKAAAALNAEVFERTGLEGDDQRSVIEALVKLRRSPGDFEEPGDA